MIGRLQFKVVGEEPRNASAPLFCNFVGISHVGTEVQLEFIFLDINQVATQLQRREKEPTSEPASFEGKTVAKIVMPSWAFAQLKGQMLAIFEKIEVSGGSQETGKERTYGS